MHRAEISYKVHPLLLILSFSSNVIDYFVDFELILGGFDLGLQAKWEERLKKYEEEKMRRETTEFEADNTVYFSDDQQNGNEQHEL